MKVILFVSGCFLDYFLAKVWLFLTCRIFKIDGRQKVAGFHLHHSFLLIILTLLILFVRSNLSLAIFNLMPIPPLDGSHLLTALWPQYAPQIQRFFHQSGYFFLVLFVFLVADLIIGPIVGWLFFLLTGIG